ncbi:MAG TPA: sigma-70 family RNA polymerase sigma factor [Lachnospiraceae bacterium]|nr:sigma-70 family RNA polymerase sigma factor [Lachnospiraceae bacterium]
MEETYESIVDYILANQNKFYRIAYTYVYSKEHALDIVQNAICKALTNYGTLRNPDAIKTWFYRILVNESLQYKRANQREISTDVSMLKEEGYVESGFEREDDIFLAIQTLSKEQHTVIILHYLEQLTLKEIAKVTKTHLSTVKSRLYAALEKLRKDMEGYQYE